MYKKAIFHIFRAIIRKYVGMRDISSIYLFTSSISNFGVVNLSLANLDRTCSNFDNKLVSLVFNYRKYCFLDNFEIYEIVSNVKVDVVDKEILNPCEAPSSRKTFCWPAKSRLADHQFGKLKSRYKTFLPRGPFHLSCSFVLLHQDFHGSSENLNQIWSPHCYS